MASAEAFLSWDRWVVDCSNPDCTNAIEVTPEQATASCLLAGGGLGADVCGAVTDVVWPTSPTAAEVAAALAGQAPQNQSWSPGQDLPE